MIDHIVVAHMGQGSHVFGFNPITRKAGIIRHTNTAFAIARGHHHSCYQRRMVAELTIAAFPGTLARYGIGQPGRIDVRFQIGMTEIQHFLAARKIASRFKLGNPYTFATVITPNRQHIGCRQIPLLSQKGIVRQFRRCQIHRRAHHRRLAAGGIQHGGGRIALAVSHRVLETHETGRCRIRCKQDIAGGSDLRAAARHVKHRTDVQHIFLPVDIIGQQLLLADQVRLMTIKQLAGLVLAQYIADRQRMVEAGGRSARNLDPADIPEIGALDIFQEIGAVTPGDRIADSRPLLRAVDPILRITAG